MYRGFVPARCCRTKGKSPNVSVPCLLSRTLNLTVCWKADCGSQVKVVKGNKNSSFLRGFRNGGLSLAWLSAREGERE